MNGAQFLIRALEAEGTEYVFGYPGGAVMPVYDALLEASFKHILTRHEQGAALAADGYARASGKVGVCLATSGPGATNLITGIANAFLDSVPLVAVTGQVASELMGTDAFQEVDTLGLTMPIVKHGFLPKTADDLVSMVPEAFRIARSGRPGPVIIDLPKDVAMGEVSRPHFTGRLLRPEQKADEPSLQAARNLLVRSKKPVLYAGGGIVAAGAESHIRAFAEHYGIPTVTTLKGIGSIPGDHPLCLGMLGMHGTRAANHAVHDADLLIVVGARLDDRATGKLNTFAPNAALLHLDIDPAELGKLKRPHVSLLGNLAFSLQSLVGPKCDFTEWRTHCQSHKRQTAWCYDTPGDRIYGPDLLRRLSACCPDKTIITCDVGQHQMWVAQHMCFASGYRHLSSGGLGTMGYGLPAAIGAWFAKPDHQVVVVSGDGSIMMNIQELATLKRYEIPIKVVLFDNSRLGMVRQWQTEFFEDRQSEVDLSDNPEFTTLAEGFGVPGRRLEKREDMDEAISEMLAAPGPFFLHVPIDSQSNVWPLVPPGKSNIDMIEGAHT